MKYVTVEFTPEELEAMAKVCELAIPVLKDLRGRIGREAHEFFLARVNAVRAKCNIASHLLGPVAINSEKTVADAVKGLLWTPDKPLL